MTIRIQVNGESREVPEGTSLHALLEGLSLPPLRVAVERNRQVVPRGRYESERLEAGDRLEIVTLVGGG